MIAELPLFLSGEWVGSGFPLCSLLDLVLVGCCTVSLSCCLLSRLLHDPNLLLGLIGAVELKGISWSPLVWEPRFLVRKS